MEHGSYNIMLSHWHLCCLKAISALRLFPSFIISCHNARIVCLSFAFWFPLYFCREWSCFNPAGDCHVCVWVGVCGALLPPLNPQRCLLWSQLLSRVRLGKMKLRGGNQRRALIPKRHSAPRIRSNWNAECDVSTWLLALSKWFY